MKYLIDFIAASITLFLGLKCLTILFKCKLKINLLNIFVIVLGTLVIMFYSYYGDNVTRPLNNLTVLFVCSLIIYKESAYVSLLYSLICHLFIGLYEIVLSIIFISLKFIDLNGFDNNPIFKAIFSFVILIMVYFTLKRKFILNIIDRISKNKRINNFIILLLIIFILIIMVFDFDYSQSMTYKSYLSNIIMIICLVAIIIIIVKDHIQVQKEIDKSAVLLNFMKRYEKIIDENRETNHELLNNLLVLKSMKNRKSKEYNTLLDELIDRFTNKGMRIKKIYNLPTGIKGIFYYKLYGLNENEYNININVSENVKNMFKKIEHNNYVTLSKVIAIVLDNAIEACTLTDNKCISVDVYNDGNKIIIDIVNTFKGSVKIKSLNNKKYSTKGKNRGYGLYIMNKLLKDNNSIEVEQSIKDHFFYTKIIVKEK